MLKPHVLLLSDGAEVHLRTLGRAARWPNKGLEQSAYHMQQGFSGLSVDTKKAVMMRAAACAW
jgi:hypothetical protein